MFIRSELFKETIDIVTFANEAFAPYQMAISLATICYVAPVILFKIFEKNNNYSISGVKQTFLKYYLSHLRSCTLTS